MVKLSILDAITDVSRFLVQSRYFVILLICASTVKLFMVLRGEREKRFHGDLIELKRPYVLFVLSLFLVVCVVSTVSGRGSDSWYFTYVVNTMRTDGVNMVFRTDRVVVNYIAYVIGEILSIPGRVSVPVVGIVSAIFYVVSVFVFVRVLTGSTSSASVAALFAASTNGIRQLTVCFIWNVFGLSLILLFFSTVALMLRGGEKGKYYGCLAVIILVTNFFVHNFSVVVTVGILFVFTCLVAWGRDKVATRRLVLLLGVCIIIVWCFISVIPIYGDIVYDVGTQKISLSNIFKFGFIEGMANDWSSEYVWIFVLSTFGVFSVMWGESIFEKITTAWVVTILGAILVTYSGGDTARMYLYLPLPVFSVVGLEWFIRNHTRHKRRKIISIFVLCLFAVTYVFFIRTGYTNIRYFERGPFPWDAKHVELEHLMWVLEEYDPREIVVITDIMWGTPISESNHPELMGGFHYRLLYEVGNNIYVGTIADLFQGFPDYRAEHPVKPYHTQYLGFYSSLNVDWVLENKTIVVLSTIYHVQELELEILYQTEKEGIFVVKDLTEQEKVEWLARWAVQ